MRSSVSGLCVDDFHADAIEHSPLVKDSRHYRPVLEAIRAGRDCVIADIAFCEPNRKLNLLQAMRAQIPAVNIEWIYFENAPAKCRRNIQRRNRQTVMSELEALEKFATLYVIPNGVTPRPVKEPTDDQTK